MQSHEDLIGVVARARGALGAGEQPELRGVLLEPGRAAPATMPQPVDERLIDRQDPLLTLRRDRRKPTRLVHQRVLDRAEVDVDRWQSDAQVVAQAADRRSGAPFRQSSHRWRS